MEETTLETSFNPITKMEKPIKILLFTKSLSRGKLALYLKSSRPIQFNEGKKKTLYSLDFKIIRNPQSEIEHLYNKVTLKLVYQKCLDLGVNFSEELLDIKVTKDLKSMSNDLTLFEGTYVRTDSKEFQKLSQQISQMTEKVRKAIIDQRKENQSKLNDLQNSHIIMNVQELADYLDCTKYSIYNKTSRNLIPHHTSGRKLFFFKNEILDWLREN